MPKKKSERVLGILDYLQEHVPAQQNPEEAPKDLTRPEEALEREEKSKKPERRVKPRLY